MISHAQRVVTGLVGAALVAAMPAGASPASRSLAGHHWHYRAQVDGVGGPDRVTLRGDHDLTLQKYGGGSGHFTVTVHLVTGHTMSLRRKVVDYYSSRKKWTPWYGATDIDRRSGKELVLGFTTGAHAQEFHVFADHHGSLVALHAPGGKYSGWLVNSSYGTGSYGWKCTTSGVEGRLVYPNARRTRFHITRTSFAYRSGGWIRIHRYSKWVDADAHGNPPHYTDHYPSFACPGLPKSF